MLKLITHSVLSVILFWGILKKIFCVLNSNYPCYNYLNVYVCMLAVNNKSRLTLRFIIALGSLLLAGTHFTS